MRQQLHDIVRIKFRLMFDGILTHDLSSNLCRPVQTLGRVGGLQFIRTETQTSLNNP